MVLGLRNPVNKNEEPGRKKKLTFPPYLTKESKPTSVLNTTACKPVISNRLTESEAINLRFITAGRKLLEGQVELRWARNSALAKKYMPPTFTAMEQNGF